MKKKLLIAALVLALILMLAGCGCEHAWVEANCVAPQTCSLCQQTEGAPLGHSWLAANCADPKTCENCGTTEGEAKGHIWVDATCTVPEKCSVCHETKGDPLEHSWEEATTEAPKTCTNCGKTEGTKIQTDPRFTTASTKHLHGLWGCDVIYTGEMIGMPDYFDEVPCTVLLEFSNDGNLNMSVEIHDRFAFLDKLKVMITDMAYASLAEQGIGKSQASEAIQEMYGMTMDEYIEKLVDSSELDAFFENFTQDMVYYVGNDKIYFSPSWLGEFEPSEYTLEDGVLIIEEETLGEDGEPLEFVRKSV